MPSAQVASGYLLQVKLLLVSLHVNAMCAAHNCHHHCTESDELGEGWLAAKVSAPEPKRI